MQQTMQTKFLMNLIYDPSIRLAWRRTVSRQGRPNSTPNPILLQEGANVQEGDRVQQHGRVAGIPKKINNERRICVSLDAKQCNLVIRHLRRHPSGPRAA